MRVLGISSLYHDSAAALIEDGNIICAVEEERFSRIKHDNAFPYKSITYCLTSSNLTIHDIDYIIYYEKPLLKFERILESIITSFPLSITLFLKTIPEWLQHKIKIAKIIEALGYKKRVLFIPHHLSHAAASFYTSSFKESTIVTVDGVGEWQTTAIWKAENNKITLLKSIMFPHSLGLFYSTITAYLGYQINEDEYIVMGLASYGKPIYVEELKKLITFYDDGSFRLSMSYFSYTKKSQMWSRKLEELLGKPRKKGESITQRHKNIAASLQRITEDGYFALMNHASEITSSKNLCLSGGVALNAVANGKLHKTTPFKQIHAFGPAGDSGCAIGASLYGYYLLSKPQKRPFLISLALGSEYTDDEIRSVLKLKKLSFTYYSREKELLEKASSLLAKNKIVGWFQGKMEFGPRALGYRSLLANPKPQVMKERMNTIKYREQFRPFAGSILEEYVSDYFIVPNKIYSSPFMTCCFPVRADKKEQLKAITHIDNSCRIQTVNKNGGRYYQLLECFFKKTGVPCLMNTSFNVKGEPIVETPLQAVHDFIHTSMDYLVIGNFIVRK